ncbi:hypothetical protein [Sphingomonas hylomeconis]|uniref:Uncharacterized protein n=1 Tax=Sphingomonas hylomeconis TaxID=1395958 RepID=A0ABV7SYA9_9SPHN|nr:hypothetical protein [Sphingomonas hylomeconis]
MKFTHLIAAALMFVGIGVSTEASAQRHDGYSQIDRRDGFRDDRRGDRRDYRRDDRRYDRHDNRRNDRRWRNNGRHNGWNNNRRHNGWNNNNRRPCRVIYRNHRRVTVCR